MHSLDNGFWKAAGRLAAVALILLAGTAMAGGKHAMVRLHLDSEADRDAFRAAAGTLDVAKVDRDGRWADVVADAEGLAVLRELGPRLELLQEDLESFYAQRLGDTRGFGVWHTYSEAVAFLDSMRMLYPNVVSAKFSLGNSHQGNPLWCVRVSDNPSIDENEPETLFDGMHHAREIMSSEFCLMFVQWLAQRYYAGDPETLWLLNNREVYLVPIVNPDGVLYNEQTDPNGGGMWRKNRRNNGDGSYGVDLNRNYSYEWGCDWGSSGYPSDETYRGPAAGSEPEVQAMMSFINAHDFVIRQSFHSVAALNLYPWGFTNNPTPDEATFRMITAEMARYNGYTCGQPGEVLYQVCGDNMDWDYGATGEHSMIFGVSTEFDGSGFWPTAAERQPLFDENLQPSLYLIQVSGTLRGVTFAHDPLPFTADCVNDYYLTAVPSGFEGTPIDPATVQLHYRVGGGAWLDLAMLPTGNPGEFGASIPAQPFGSVVEYYLEAADILGRTGTSPGDAPLSLHYFETGDTFTHDMEAARGWTAGAADDDASSGLWERVDPVGTAAQPENDHSADGTLCWVTGQHLAGQSIGYNDVDNGKTTLFSPGYDVTGATECSFGYWMWYSNNQGSDPNNDYWDVYLSNDGGETWSALEHTTTSTNAWVERAFNLFDYVAEPGVVQIKFVASDEGSGSVVEAAVDDFSLAAVIDVTGAEQPALAFRVELDQNFPNPFNPTTSIRFTLAEGGPVSLAVFDAQGRRVRLLHGGALPAGEHFLRWDGRDDAGRPIASGSYFCKLSAEGVEVSKRMVLIK